ncbi:hypothetical protein BCR37DRAFT_283588 [Protomyces lactucae-debilis]|uniref:Methylthioribose-1-phosphate isomerase n=1 Tax=Protomyces lactucae-debilis TaxID=2754530 RepID=A0A1Y2FIU6_PROLT|nr:uncharacterized protein BCR37DRAFT_283588 [Protomyces lactucae-debilis]ORY83859.1 hypothetical protein BCR37DRAFT_283588 [Protomyces lactucae-debilis]
MVLKAIDYDAARSTLQILDQLVLPHNMLYIPIHNSQDAFDAIKSMKVRGAPAIALVAILGLAVDLEHNFKPSKKTAEEIKAWLIDRLDFLVQSRPTAVNLHDAAEKLKRVISGTFSDGATIAKRYKEAAEAMFASDLQDNLSIGRHGARHILNLAKGRPINMLTICNTGSLATSGYGTAYSVLYQLHEVIALTHAYFCETRPYNQGARLTATELHYDGIPSTMVLDSSIAALLAGANPACPTTTNGSGITAIVVGADRVARNGDTANKIGTQQLATLARFAGVPFFVAAPWTTIDLQTPSGKEITIEQRPASEVRRVAGALLSDDGSVVLSSDGQVQRGFVEVVKEEIAVWNPAFDVTPYALISGIITERDVYVKNAQGVFELAEEAAKVPSQSKPSTVTTSNEEHQ